MEYSAGNLELSILGFSEKAVASIDVTAKALRRLASSVDKINNTQFVFAGQKLEVLFSKIAKATNSINTTNITNLASAAKSLSSISRLSNLEKMDFDKVGKGFNTLAVAIQPFLDKVKQAEASLTSLDNILKRSSGKKIQGLLGGNEKSKGGLFGFAKLGVNLYMMRRMGRFMANLVQAGSDYTETLNLWQVAMRNNLDVADQFINKMNKAYGISSKNLMNAQATFKNMIGSLGQISDQTAYTLSEALVQMTADYASLYNRTLQSAVENMQSMLAGQVRPIRAAGLDITETTLYMFYQQLGGTKSMRQLNRTEKQLLSILAVYKQMGTAGALGDMTKTLNSFANQSRMMAEYWSELKVWSGLILKDLLEDWQVLTYINAALITATEIVKAIAKSRGLGEENFLNGLFETTSATNDEVDELQGKLLDFDKFRSLEGANNSPFAIDEKVLEAITGYSSQLDNANSAASELAKSWLSVLGFTKDANGQFTISSENIDNIVDGFNSIVISIGVLVGMKFIPWIINLITKADWLALSIKLLNYALLTGAVYAIMKAIEAFEKGEYWAVILATAIGVTLVGAFLLLKRAVIIDGIPYLDLFGKTINGTVLTSIVALTASFSAFSLFLNQFTGTGKKIASWAVIVVGAITAVTAAVLAMNSVISWGTAIPVLLAGVGAAIAGVQGLMPKVDMYATGASDIDSGTLFVAGEMGKTEAVYTGSNGKTNVANIQQMKTAYTQALNEWWKTAKNDIPEFEGASDSGLYTVVSAEARRRGQKFAKV
jgi:hypothetical protein